MANSKIKKSFNKAKGVGILLDLSDVEELISSKNQIDWIEVILEHIIPIEKKSNKMRLSKRMREAFEKYPVSLHGIEMNLGSTDPLDMDYFRKLKRLIAEVKPFQVSDHLVWTSANGVHSHELIPIPYTEEAAANAAERISKIQDYLGTRILVENPPNYIQYKQSEMSEAEFFTEVSNRADCGILVDICNLKINEINNNISPFDFIDCIPAHRIAQFHIIGYEIYDKFAVDTHSVRTGSDVWSILKKAIDKLGPISTNIEWDQKVPSFQELCNEAKKAAKIVGSSAQKAA